VHGDDWVVAGVITDIAPISEISQMLAVATQPAQTRAIESMAQAAKAYAKERGDYEGVVNAVRVYILARMKTTELIQPHVQQGGDRKSENQGNNVVTLIDFGFTKMQWNRRTKELKVKDRVDEYLDECIANGWEPSLHGLLSYALKAHVSHNSGENEWYTPSEYIEAAREVMGRIDLDPASSEIANQIVGASKFYTAEGDGLSKFWAGKVWLNPPYSGDLIIPFIAKYAEHVRSGDVGEGIVLVNNATETNWFKELVSVSSAIVFPKGRVRFLDPDGNPGAPLQGQAVVYSGPNPDKFLREFGGFGWSARL